MLTGSLDSKECKSAKKEKLDVVEKYLGLHAITPVEYVQRFILSGNPSMLRKAMISIPRLTAKEISEFQNFLNHLITREKFSEDAKSTTSNGHNTRISFVLCCCYPLLFPNKNRFETFFKELQKNYYPHAFTFWALPRLDTAEKENALACLNKGLENGCIIALEVLGDIYLQGKYGIKKDKSFGRSLYKRALMHNSANAQYYLGKNLYHNKLVPSEPEKYLHALKKAYDFVEAAASQGHPNAMIQLGFMVRFGLGTPKDLDKAIKIFEAVFKNPNLRYTKKEEIQIAQDAASRALTYNLPWLLAVPPRDELPKHKLNMLGAELAEDLELMGITQDILEPIEMDVLTKPPKH